MNTSRAAGLGIAPVVAASLGLLCGTACRTSTLRRLRTELAEARRVAERDALTGLLNRAGLEQSHRRLTGIGAHPTMVLIDLDGFKAVNDTWGHQAGDALLTVVAERLAAGCANIGAVPGRLAGDEFLLLIPHARGNTVRRLTPAVLATLGTSATLHAGDHRTIEVLPMASAGIALPEPHAGHEDTWRSQLHRADIALYHAKIERGHAVTHIAGMCHPPRARSLPAQAAGVA